MQTAHVNSAYFWSHGYFEMFPWWMIVIGSWLTGNYRWDCRCVSFYIFYFVIWLKLINNYGNIYIYIYIWYIIYKLINRIEFEFNFFKFHSNIMVVFKVLRNQILFCLSLKIEFRSCARFRWRGIFSFLLMNNLCKLIFLKLFPFSQKNILPSLLQKSLRF